MYSLQNLRVHWAFGKRFTVFYYYYLSSSKQAIILVKDIVDYSDALPCDELLKESSFL